MPQRVIKYKGKTIPDDYPELPMKAVQKLLAEQYPEIINATYTETINKETGDLEVSFGTAVTGTRG